MPSFSYLSSIRVASQDHVLCLRVIHNLAYGSPSDVPRTVRGRFPKDLDVLWLSDVGIALSGSLDGRETPAHAIARSGLVHHLQMQLKANADRLGLNNVSRQFVDDADGLTKMTLTPSRPLPCASRPHASLISLHLVYIWRTVTHTDVVDSASLVEKVDPFSPVLFLPTEALLNRATEQFLTYHVVGRYPLIFGPWCMRLDLETQYFPSIGQSVAQIMSRSKNDWFLSKCKRLLKIARRQHEFVIQTSTAALRAYTDGDPTSGTSEEEIDSALVLLTDGQVLCESLEQLFRVGVPRRRFKPAAPRFVSPPQEDDGLLLPTPDQEADSWVELSEIAASPCGFLANFRQTSPAEVDIFTWKDAPEDEKWRLGEVDMGQGESQFDTQSDESLISASISLASIVTGSPGACPFVRYEHQGVDCHELDPAASGLRYDLALLEDPGTPLLFTNVTHAPHDHRSRHYHHPGSFERLDDFSEGGEEEDSEWALFEEDGDVSDGAEMTEMLV